jgi:mono/diheme cytochrome c family protein
MQGRKDQGMPNFEGVLNEDQIRNIYAYVLARAKKGLPAGRPKH